MIVNFLNKLEQIEKEYGMLGTIVGILAMLVVVAFYIGSVLLLTKWCLDTVSWLFGLIVPGGKIM